VSVAEPAATGLETAAAARLYERHSSRVFGYCLRMLGSREDAEDASQTTFMQAFRALQRGVVPAFETAWLLTIAKNVCLARHRSGGRRRAVEIVRDPQDLEELAAGPPQGDGELMGLQDALVRLPEMQRRAFLLREWQGRSYAEIASELGVTIAAVEGLVHRARRALARDLRGGTRARRHALDLASLVAALKSLLGGGAAVKLAVGAAVVVGAGAVAGGVVERGGSPAPVKEIRQPAPLPSSPALAPTDSLPRRADHMVARPTTTAARQGGRTAAPSAASTRRTQKPEPDPVVPAMPPPTGPGAESPAAPTPNPQAAAPAQPAPQPAPLPSVPGVPDPPAVPVPELPEIPGVELPQPPVDELPVPVPELPEVPGVPDLPVLR
jgi:RNA polymerase sigma-70 factor, ECF subfamily